MDRIVLVADDSPTIQKRAVTILQGEGYEVETASNGVAAIKRLAVLHPVLILADVSMPGRDGYEVCDFVKKSPELSHVPVLLVASDMEPYDDAKGAQVRADGIIKKPFEARELISLVQRFANKTGAAAVKSPLPPVVRPEERESTREFTAFSEGPDVEPTLLRHAEPDFSDHAAGRAFAQPGGDGTQEFALESHPNRAGMPFAEPPVGAPAFLESLFERPGVGGEEYPMAGASSSDPVPAAPSTPTLPSPGPSIFDELMAARTEPVFIEEPPAHASEHDVDSGARTMIFTTPLAIADPVWQDNTAPAPPLIASAGPAALPRQLEALTAAAPGKTHAEQLVEASIAPAEAATNLASFSLDDAAAGQVHPGSRVQDYAPTDLAHFNPAEEVTLMGLAPLDAPEAANASSAANAAPRAVSAESVLSESGPEALQTEAAPAPAASATVYAESVPFDFVPEAGATAAAPADAGPEAVPAEAAAANAEPGTPSPERTTEATVPPPAFDWNLFYTVVHKAVVKMSPPILPAELVDEIARRLADEIAIEITSGSAPRRV